MNKLDLDGRRAKITTPFFPVSGFLEIRNFLAQSLMRLPYK